MSKVLVCCYSRDITTFYDSFCESLVNCGNDVLSINIENLISFKEWGSSYKMRRLYKNILYKKVILFNPDIVFSFNNTFPAYIIKKLKCPICILDSDTPNVGFWNKNDILQNVNRYTFLGFQSNSKEMYKQCFGNISKYMYFPPATSFINKKSKKKYNISFIGSNFLQLRESLNRYNFISDKNIYYDILEIYKKKDRYLSTYSFSDFRKFCFNSGDKSYDFRVYNFIHSYGYSGMERIKVLDSMSDLGLTIFGTESWRELLNTNIDLASCYDKKKIITKEDNEKVYNSSKISINISHRQAVSGFSWRVMDIMASGSCLLTEYKKDWFNLFGRYISKETLIAITYKDAYDARKKAQYLLNNENFRLKCVRELNKAIENNGRWSLRFKDFSNAFGYSLSNSIKKGKLQKFEIKKKKIDLQFKKRLKIIISSILLSLGQIPLISHSIVTRKFRQKLLDVISNNFR